MTVAMSSRSALRWLVAAAAAQVVLLAAASPDGALGNAAACTVALAVPIAVAQRWPQRWWQAAAIAGALGGLGMLIGARLDGAALPACHTGTGAFDAMTAGMLVGCVVGCLWLMPACRGVRPWLGHTACFVGMVLGMVLGARWLPGMLDAMVNPPATHHIAMALGMMIGAGGGTRAIHEEAALDPPGSTTSSTPRLGRTGQAALPAGPHAQLRRAADP